MVENNAQIVVQVVAEVVMAVVMEVMVVVIIGAAAAVVEPVIMEEVEDNKVHKLVDPEPVVAAGHLTQQEVVQALLRAAEHQQGTILTSTMQIMQGRVVLAHLGQTPIRAI
jgi:hypothetical protein